MCGRFTSSQGPEDVFSETGLSPPLDWRPHFNVAPSQDVLALRTTAQGRHELAYLKWGLVPEWAHDIAVGRRLVMARAETIDDKSTFHAAFRGRRCAIVADGFYEWQRAKGGSTPFYFRFIKPMFIAGIWERFRRFGHDIQSCAVITTEANASVSPIHERMPVLLDAEGARAWLDPQTPIAGVKLLLVPAHEASLRIFAVDKAVNNPLNDSAALLGEFEEEARLFGVAHG